METCRGIILNTVPFSDTQKIIHLYAKEKGYLSMLSPSSVFKRKNAPLHLLQITEVEYLENPKGGLHKLKSAAPLVQLPALYFDVVKMNIILLWGEILSRLLRNEGPNEPLFDFITRSVEYLNASEGDTANFNLYFLYRLTAPLGYRINTDTWQPGALFNPHDGCFHLPGTTANTISPPSPSTATHATSSSTPSSPTTASTSAPTSTSKASTSSAKSSPDPYHSSRSSTTRSHRKPFSSSSTAFTTRAR